MTKSTFFQKLSTRTNMEHFYRTLPQESTSKLVTRPSRRQEMRLFHLKTCRWTTKRLSSLMTWFVKAAKTPSSTISSTSGTETAALFISLKPFTRYPKTSATTVAIFAFFPRENKRIADELGVDHQLLDSATDKKYSFFYYAKPQKLMKKILMKICTMGYLNSTIDETGSGTGASGPLRPQGPPWAERRNRPARATRIPRPNWAPWYPWPNRPPRTFRCGKTGWRPWTDRPKRG